MTGRRTVSTRSANLFYVTTDALRSLKENFTTTVFTSVTLGFALALFSLFLIVFINLNGIITQWGERAHVVAYLAPEVDSKDVKGIEAGLKGMEGVLETTYVSSKDALDDLRSELQGHESILEGVNPGLLPASFEIGISDEYLSAEALARLVAAVEKIKGVEEVSYSREWVEKLSALLSFIELAALVIGAFLAAADHRSFGIGIRAGAIEFIAPACDLADGRVSARVYGGSGAGTARRRFPPRVVLRIRTGRPRTGSRR